MSRTYGKIIRRHRGRDIRLIDWRQPYIQPRKNFTVVYGNLQVIETNHFVLANLIFDYLCTSDFDPYCEYADLTETIEKKDFEHERLTRPERDYNPDFTGRSVPDNPRMDNYPPDTNKIDRVERDSP